MQRRYIHTFDDLSPEGYEKAFSTNELERVGKRFGYHPERHNALLYGDIAETLRDGKHVLFPLGLDRIDRPNGIEFRFEHVDFLATFPDPETGETLVTICSKVGIEESKMIRVAHVFGDHFVTEYKAHYSHAIAISKKENKIS